MITKIDVSNVAAFSAATQTLDDLRKLNFFFGANGSGKTTIGKVIATPLQFRDCAITWANATALETRVYNRDFVERNFSHPNGLKGVFTLGEQEAGALEKIEAAKAEIDRIEDDIARLTITLKGHDGTGGKKRELDQLETLYCDRFWLSKQKHDAKLSGGLEGYRGSKENFKSKVLFEAANNTSTLKALADLEAMAALVFSKTLERADNIRTIQPERLLSLENGPILRKRVVGKEDVSIAAIITKLGNSDWVRQGLSYYEASDGICPFCQQATDEGLAKILSEYFDETFEQDNIAIDELLSEYSKESHWIQQQVQAVINERSEFIENDKLDQEIRLLDSKIMVNIQLLNQKKKETSRVIELDSLRDTLGTINEIIAAANKAIDERNAIVSNLATERGILTAQIWKYIVDELKSDIDYYSREKSSLLKAIGSIKEKLKMREQEKSSKEEELRALEKQIVSIQPTLDGINRLLTSFGFRNFSLAKGGDNRTYKLVRANGSDAQDTLSEGERNFVTFLYFYYLLKGSQSESGITANKIVVFDDPVSSLDSDVLFIVSSLIRELFDDVCQDKGTIKQIFVLTHNVYFHKEITYNSRRGKDGCLTDESFWLIKKSGVDSVVERQTTNPIKTAYELLWEEVRSTQRNNMTIQNTLRRILENYFRLLGGISLDDLYHNFEGGEKTICKALCSWVNDGSHSVFDDDYCTMPCDTTVARYLDTFRRIFENCGQIAHYNMMMGFTND